MKVRIKTAHGYMSFQPDGRVEYRAAAGPWEEIDIEGLEFPAAIIPGGGGGGIQVPPDKGPPASQSAEYVAAVKAMLQAQGVNLSGPCGAFAITKRVAWGLRATGAGLLSKPAGNNCEGFATDIVAFHDRAFDILSDGGGTNGPNWSETGVDDLANMAPAVSPGPTTANLDSFMQKFRRSRTTSPDGEASNKDPDRVMRAAASTRAGLAMSTRGRGGVVTQRVVPVPCLADRIFARSRAVFQRFSTTPPETAATPRQTPR